MRSVKIKSLMNLRLFLLIFVLGGLYYFSVNVPFKCSKIIINPSIQRRLPFYNSFDNLPDENIIDSNWRNLTDSEISQLSVLGRRLFLSEDIGEIQQKMFTIHVWKHYNHIIKRFINRYTDHPYDPFEGCSVNNCKFTSADEDVINADAVLFHMHQTKEPPINISRNSNQIWVWMADESPKAIFAVSGDNDITHYSGIFNWSMTYRMDSDVPVPYGRTLPLSVNEKPMLIDSSKRKNGVVLLASHCFGANGRFKYINKLKQYLKFDIFGKCGVEVPCPGHFRKNCDVIDDYKIYIAFENNNCDDYISEKVWWNALGKGNVPVVMGTTKENYKKILPPNSFIHVDDFQSPQELANYLQFLLETPIALAKYHEWRKYFKIVNEHGYFQSPVFHFCRLCEALNYNDRSKLPKNADMYPFFSSKYHCYQSKYTDYSFF